ncbi:hypothetical protein HXX76_003056 [Chlamydomonas incerta]|uniref:Protein EXECUTER 1, chloroplastic n=1 Tax=Chlamydomonas incerta TaxID=51695 RepID=A0A835TGC1_CHLIN|nr:hypothetical protein HXX76_003056 [Chlamydomonas incerta]|eukprot:KAG2442983.1 hypothetical protein HXX76_003056 [Chlamydomonas incerta]
MERASTMRAGHRHTVSSNVLPGVPFRGLTGPTPFRLPPCVGRRSWACSALSDGGSQGTSAAVNPKLVADKAQLEISENPQGRSGAPGVKGERERVDGSELLTQGSSWEEWLKHFDAMDELAEDAAHYQVELNSAVRTERYGDAARFKKRLGEVAAADTVAAVQRQLQTALASEQYSEAAELRDRGLVGLAGWWAGKDGPEDFQGHLLHVKPEFGRWTGRIYMARDIATMNGWRENKMMALLDRADRGGAAAGGASLRGAYEASNGGGGGGLGGGTIGTPMMEVFIRQQGQEPAAGGAAGGVAGAEQLQQKLQPSLLAHQAVALRPPAPKAPKAGAAAGKEGEAKAVGAGAAALNPASVVRLSIHVARDGSARISVLPPKAVKSEFSSWEEEEMRATMAALAGDSLGSPGPKKAAGGLSAMSSSKAAGKAPAAAAGSAVAAPASAGAAAGEEEDDDILTELTRVPAQVAMQGRDRFTFTVLEQDASNSSRGAASSSSSSSASASGVVAGEEAMASGSSVDLPRWAAVPIDDDDSSGDEAESAAASERRASAASASSSSSSSASMTEVPVVEVEVEVELAPKEGDDEVTARRRSMLEAAAAMGLGDDEEAAEEGSELKVSFDMLSAGYGRVDAVATSVSDDEEQRIVIEIPVGRLIRQQQRAAAEAAEAEARRASGAEASSSSSAASGASSSKKGKDTFDRLAERVAQLQAARAGRPVPPEHLASALRQLAQRLVAGELAADGTSAATATVPSPAQAAKAAAAAAKAAARAVSNKDAPASSSSSSQQLGATRISYGRIPTDLPRSDPFCGLYLGAFGPHGPELIQLSRGLQDGEEVVSAVKVTGDPNVPAGEVSFRAKVGRRHKLDSRDVYPDELGIVARYKGEGRVAMAGYKSPRWVDGELLVFAVGASPVTGGAQLGFVWSVPGEKRFLILLNKLDLKECEK